MTSPLRSVAMLLVLAAIGASGTQEVDPKAATCASKNADPGTCAPKEPELGDTMLQRGSGRSQTTVTEDDSAAVDVTFDDEVELAGVEMMRSALELAAVQNASFDEIDDDDAVASLLELVAVENMPLDENMDEEADVSGPDDETLKEKWIPKVFGKKGVYFGFGNNAANKFFGTEKWNKQTYNVEVDGKVVAIKVWKDNKLCKCSCGRRVDKKVGSWKKGLSLHKAETGQGITKPSQEQTKQNLKLWASSGEEKPAAGWPLIASLNGKCREVVSVAACAEPLVPYKKVQSGAGSRKVIKWLEVAVPWMRANSQELGINKKRIAVMGYSWAGTVSFVMAAGLLGNPQGSKVNGIILVSCGKGITQFPSYFTDTGLLNGRGKPNTLLIECKQRSEYAPTLKLYKKLKKAGFKSTLHGYQCAKKNEFAAGAGLPWHYPQGEPQYLGDLQSWITTKFT